MLGPQPRNASLLPDQSLPFPKHRAFVVTRPSVVILRQRLVARCLAQGLGPDGHFDLMQERTRRCRVMTGGDMIFSIHLCRFENMRQWILRPRANRRQGVFEVTGQIMSRRALLAWMGVSLMSVRTNQWKMSLTEVDPETALIWPSIFGGASTASL